MWHAGGVVLALPTLAAVKLVGRTAELTWVQGLVDGCRERSQIITIDGAAGLGKSALLGAARMAAAGAGAVVLHCAPSEVERGYDHSALGDLLAPVGDLASLSPAIQPRQRLALDAALLRGAPSPAASDPRAVGLGLLGVVSALAAAPLVMLIDDVQWLDGATAAALTYAVRRLPDCGVLVLGARRSGVDGPTLPGKMVALAPLTDREITTLLSEVETGPRRLTTREVRSIVAVAAGNPMFALELARHAGGRPEGDDTLSLPNSLHEVVAARLGRLADDVRAAMATIALAGRPDLALVQRLGLGPSVLAAEAAGVVTAASGRVTFEHPLLAAAVIDSVTAGTLREAHAALADAVADPAEKVLHAARAATGRDAALAMAAAGEAARLSALGANDRATDLALLAARLTPDDDPAAHGRLVDAAELAFQRGQGAVTRDLLAAAAGRASDRTQARREQMVRAVVDFSLGGGEARQRALAALEICDTDAERVEVQSLLARVSYDDFDASLAHADAAWRLAQECELSTDVRVQVLTARATEALMAGYGLDREMFEQAIALEDAVGEHGRVLHSANSAFASYAVLLKVIDELDEARTMLASLLDDNDDDGTLPFVLSHLPQLELWTGNWDAAEEYAHRHLDVALRTGQHDQAEQARNNVAQVKLMRGDVGEAARLAADLAQRGREQGDLWTERSALGLLGLVALAEGDAPAAVPMLLRWHELAERMHLREPGYCRLRADLVEALVATGALDEAEQMVCLMRDDGERLGRVTVQAAAARVAGLLAAARGDRALALAEARRAVAEFAAGPLVFEHARALLTLGQIHRRFKEKAAARESLHAALAVFERLGAERFAERCRQDLSRIGLRAPAATALTETERRVAELAAKGRTVRQVADELFISPKTVEANLTRVYRKLGVAGRAELARWAVAAEGATHS